MGTVVMERGIWTGAGYITGVPWTGMPVAGYIITGGACIVPAPVTPAGVRVDWARLALKKCVYRRG